MRAKLPVSDGLYATKDALTCFNLFAVTGHQGEPSLFTVPIVRCILSKLFRSRMKKGGGGGQGVH